MGKGVLGRGRAVVAFSVAGGAASGGWALLVGFLSVAMDAWASLEGFFFDEVWASLDGRDVLVSFVFASSLHAMEAMGNTIRVAKR